MQRKINKAINKKNISPMQSKTTRAQAKNATKSGRGELGGAVHPPPTILSP